jgi:hypothetical protein
MRAALRARQSRLRAFPDLTAPPAGHRSAAQRLETDSWKACRSCANRSPIERGLTMNDLHDDLLPIDEALVVDVQGAPFGLVLCDLAA